MSHAQGQALAQEFGIAFFETSAKLNINVDEAFMAMARDIVERLKKDPVNGTNGHYNLQADVDISIATPQEVVDNLKKNGTKVRLNDIEL